MAEEKYHNDEEKDDSLSLEEIIAQVRIYWNALWRMKWIIIACILIGGGIGVTYSILREVHYKASYTFSIEGSGGGGAMGALSSLAGLIGFGGGGTGGVFSGDNLVELLKSKRLIEQTLLSPTEIGGEKETFIEYYITTVKEMRKDCEKGEKKDTVVTICDIYFPLGQDRETFTREQNEVLMGVSSTFLKKNITVVRRDKKLAFVDLSFTSTDELFAKHFADALLNEVSAFYIDTKTSLSRKNIEIFQLQADSVRQALNNALSSRAYYADENVNAVKQVVGVQLQRKQMDIQIYGTAYAEMIKNIEMLKLDLARETPLIRIIDSPVFPLEKDKWGKKKGLIAGGFLGGFLSSLAIIAWMYIANLRKKLMPEPEED